MLGTMLTFSNITATVGTLFGNKSAARGHGCKTGLTLQPSIRAVLGTPCVW
jgi:hypothetical protein